MISYKTGLVVLISAVSFLALWVLVGVHVVGFLF